MSVLYHFSIMPAHPVSWWRHVLTPLGMWPGATLSHQLSKTTERVITSECCQVPGPLAWHQVLSSGAGCQTLHSPAGADSGQARNILFIAIWGGSYIKMTTRKKTSHLHCWWMTILDAYLAMLPWAWAWEYYTGWPLLHCPMPDVVTLWPLCPWSPHYRVKLSNSLTEVHIFLHSVLGSKLVIKI